MERMRVLLANEPRVYREVVADALKKLRPLIEVVECESEDLDPELSRTEPHIVICSEATDAVREGSHVWVLLYPDGEDDIEVGGAGLGEGATPAPVARVADLLEVLDEAALSLSPPPEENPAEG